jgi:TRAP-type C4-dicarboxylate transport system substrate-binding protein
LKNRKFSKTVHAGSIILVLVLVLSTLLAACSSSSPATTTVTSTATTATTMTSSVTSTATATATTTIKPVTLVFTSHNNGTGFWAKNVIGPYFREIEKRTHGGVRIEEQWNGELVSLKDAYDAMLKGDVDMAEWFPSMLQGRFPMEDVVSFTQVSNNRPARTLYELAQQYPQMVAPYADGKILLRNMGYSVGMFTTKKQITDLASSKGMKIGPVGKWSSALISAYGWTPISVPPEESTSALQTGVQEGSGASWYLLWEFGWGTIMKYATMPIACDEMLVDLSMNKDKFNSLPKDVQDTINGMQEWAIDLQDTAVVKNAIASPALAKQQFNIISYTLPQTEIDKMASISASVKADYVKSLSDAGLPAQPFVDKYLEICKKYADPQYAPK